MNIEARPQGAFTTNDAYLRAYSLIGLADLVKSHGHDVEPLIKEAGLPLEALTDQDSLISYRRHAMLMEIAAQKLDRPSFALEWALSLSPAFHNLGLEL